MSALRKLIALLRRREDGAMIVELVIMLPLLLWCFAGSWVFFDAYRTKAVNARAAYTIGDALSRETGYITPVYIASFKALQGVLVNDRPTRLRVSVFSYDAPNDRYTLRWSLPSGIGVAALDNANLEQMRGRLPVMPDGEIATLVESWIDYTPLFDVGLDPFTFKEMAVTRPRFAGQLCFNADLAGLPINAIC